MKHLLIQEGVVYPGGLYIEPGALNLPESLPMYRSGENGQPVLVGNATDITREDGGDITAYLHGWGESHDTSVDLAHLQGEVGDGSRIIRGADLRSIFLLENFSGPRLCEVCRNPIRIMVRKGTSLCSTNCEKAARR